MYGRTARVGDESNSTNNCLVFPSQHTLPSFMLPAQKDGIVYPLPKVVYRMFDYTDVPEVSFVFFEEKVL